MLSLKVRSVALSAAERYRPHHRVQQQCRRQLRWVPVAYRGAPPPDPREGDRRAEPARASSPSSSSSTSSMLRHPHKRRPLRKLPRKPVHHHEGVAGSHPRGRGERPSVERLELRLAGLHEDLLRFAKEYRSAFSSVPLPLPSRDAADAGDAAAAAAAAAGVNKGHDASNKDDETRATLRAIARDVRALGRDIHQADHLVESSQLERSEDSFRGVSRVLTDMIRTALSFRRSGGAGTHPRGEELVDVAEAALGTAVKMGSERALLVEQTRTWSTIQKSPFSSLWPAAALMNVLGSLFSGSGGPEEKAEENKGDSVADDPLLFSPVMFRDVLDAIASDARSKLEQVAPDDGGSQTRGRAVGKDAPTEIDRAELEATARRMVALLDVMPSSWLPDLGTMKDILEMLCRAGTLATARLCYDTYKRHPINQNRLRFSLVLQSFLEAVKHDPDEGKRTLAAQEAFEALDREWNVNQPVHRVERIVHSSIVLSCLCAAGTGNSSTLPSACDLADDTVKKCLGDAGFAKLFEDADDSAALVGPQTLPLVSCLVRIYAASGDETRIKQARSLLTYMMKHDNGAVSRVMLYPMLDTFNRVLEKLAGDLEKQSRKTADPAARFETMIFSKSLADYMVTRRDSGSWPSENTFKLLFRILLAADPPDIGERADDVLSMLDVRSYLSQTRIRDRSEGPSQNGTHRQESDFSPSLSIYHRAIRCWLRAAESPSTDHAAIRAWMLVEKLEVQSSPLLLSDRETQLRCVPPLYDLRLRPSGSTYRLVQKICMATANESNLAEACDVALKVHRRLQGKGMIAKDGSDGKGLSYALSRLPPDDPSRLAAQGVLNIGDPTPSEPAIQSFAAPP